MHEVDVEVVDVIVVVDDDDDAVVEFVGAVDDVVGVVIVARLEVTKG